MNGNTIFQQSYFIMEQFYLIIDGANSAKARAMSAEFISKNAKDLGSDLKSFIAGQIPNGYIPV